MKRASLRITTLLLFFMVLLFCVPCGYGQAAQRRKQAVQYAVTFRLPLSQDLNGVDGYLELRQDARVTAKLSAVLWGRGDINFEDDPQLAMFKSEPPHNAVIEIVNRAGEVLEARKLERPLGKLRTTQLYGDSRLTYLLTVDYSAGFGSYSGPITNLVEINSGHMRWIQSTDAKTGSTGTISLMESLKTTWRFVEAPDGKGKQVWFAQCRPNWSEPVNADPDFRTTYARIYFDGTKWLLVKRIVRGLSEFDQRFPSRKHFP